MTYEDRELLEEVYEIAKENNKMLHRMRRAAWFGGIMKLIFWIVMLGGPVWFYYQYGEPLVNDLLNTVSQIQDTSNQLQNVGSQFGGMNQEGIKHLFDVLNSIPGIDLPAGK